MSPAIKSAIIHIFGGDKITSIPLKDLAKTLSEIYEIKKGELEGFFDNELPEDYSGTVRLEDRFIILDIPERNISHRVPL